MGVGVGKKRGWGDQMFELECRRGVKSFKMETVRVGVRSFEIEVLGGQKIKT